MTYLDENVRRRKGMKKHVIVVAVIVAVLCMAACGDAQQDLQAEATQRLRLMKQRRSRKKCNRQLLRKKLIQ